LRPSYLRWHQLVIAGMLGICLTAAVQLRAATKNINCSAGGVIGSVLNELTPGDVVLVQGTCRENVLIQSEVQRIVFDGQDNATIEALDAGRPAVQVLGREITIGNFTIVGGSFGIAINRGATATLDHNTVRSATNSGFEVSHNSFAPNCQ